MVAIPIPPPLGPPPLLSQAQITHLSRTGSLALFSLSPDLVQQLTNLQSVANSFFAQPRETKRDTYPTSQGTELGYYHVPTEKEYVTLRHSVHKPAPLLEELAAECWRKAAALLYRVLADLSASLDIPLEAWDSLLDGCMSLPESAEEATPTLMRIFWYEPSTGIAEEHKDLGLLTLCVGSGAGLQVRAPGENAEWEDAAGPMVLVGSFLRLLSGNRLAAGLHRVVGNPDGRNSVVFALRPSLRHPMSTSVFGLGDEVYNTSEVWEAVLGRVFNINATKDVRERKRAELRGEREAQRAVQVNGQG